MLFRSGGELADGEVKVREYLGKIRDQTLVEEYGSWLANRNPKLGVQVFADDQSRVKFDPARAVALLREKAPGAVKDYLEYLVFGSKKVCLVRHSLLVFPLTLFAASTIRERTHSLLSRYGHHRAREQP